MFIIKNTEKFMIVVSFMTLDGFRKKLKFEVGDNEISEYDRLSLALDVNIKYAAIKKAKMLVEVPDDKSKLQDKVEPKVEVKKVAVNKS